VGLYESCVAFGMYFLAASEFSHGTVTPGDMLLAWERWTVEGPYAGVATAGERTEILRRAQTAFFVALGAWGLGLGGGGGVGDWVIGLVGFWEIGGWWWLWGGMGLGAEWGRGACGLAVMVQIWNLMGVARTRRRSLLQQPWNGRVVTGALAEVLVVIVMIFVPWINDIFNTRPLPFKVSDEEGKPGWSPQES
jgi:hypothetical protein